MKQILFTLICILLSFMVRGQCSSSQERPAWADGYFHDEENSYIRVVSANGHDEKEARKNAAQQIIELRSMDTGQQIQITVNNDAVEIKGSDNLVVAARILDEYREYCGPGQYRVTLLVQVAKFPGTWVEWAKVTNEYPFSPRVFVPGMAQLHKGNTGKGVMFIIGEVAMIGGIVVSESLRTSYESKINSTHNAANRQNYIDNANTMQNLRNGFIAGALALYAWNVIDGIVAKGKKHVLISNAGLKISPYISPYANGLTVAIKF